MKVLAFVKFNDNTAFVLDQNPVLEYTKYKTCIIGTDGIFYDFLYYEQPIGRFKAFAGREFDIKLSNGEIENCSGQWWDGINKEAKEITGTGIGRITAAYIGDLKACYVFQGMYANYEKLKEITALYKGPIYDYWDYEALIKGNKMPYMSKDKNWLKKYKTKMKSFFSKESLISKSNH